MSLETEPPFFHPDSRCESRSVGLGSKVWAFAHILPGAVVGAGCNICDHVFIENDVKVGDRVTIKCGVQLWDGVRLGNDVFVGPNATFCNDSFPRSRRPPDKFLPTVVQDGASIGANATILPGVTIGAGAMVGAGAVVTSDVRPHTVVTGNPARVSRFIGAVSDKPVAVGAAALPPQSWDSLVEGVRLIRFNFVADPRGDLTAGNFGTEIPFLPARYYFVFNVGMNEISGEQAHRDCHLVAIAARGSCSVMVDDGVNRQEYHLDNPTLGLYVPPKTWFTHYQHARDSLVVFFASHQYDPADYVRDYDGFLALKKEQKKESKGA